MQTLNYRSLARLQHRRKRLRFGLAVIVADLDQLRRRQPAVSDQFFRISEGNYVIGSAVQDHRVGFHRLGVSPALPGRAQEDDPRLASVDVHGDSTARLEPTTPYV